MKYAIQMMSSDTNEVVTNEERFNDRDALYNACIHTTMEIAAEDAISGIISESNVIFDKANWEIRVAITDAITVTYKIVEVADDN